MPDLATASAEYLPGLLSPESLPFDPQDVPEGRAYLLSDTKRALDLSLCISEIVIASPFAVAGLAAVAAVDQTNPVFVQSRIGLGGMPFDVHKIRTMPGVTENTISNGRFDDSRRSPVGRVLSKLRLDETLQTIDVIRGKMSMVGPRPLLVDDYLLARRVLGLRWADEWTKIRTLTRPGMFDEFTLKSISGEVTGEAEDMLRERFVMEEKYIFETASVGEDLRILGAGFLVFAGVVAGNHAR